MGAISLPTKWQYITKRWLSFLWDDQNVTYKTCTYLSFAVVVIFKFIHTESNKYLHIQSFIYLLIPNICWLFVWNTEQRLVTMSLSLCTWTGLRHLTIQVLDIRVCFLNNWYTSLTFVHSNLEHEQLAILTESFSPLKSELQNLTYWSPNQKWCDKPHYSYLSCTLN